MKRAVLAVLVIAVGAAGTVSAETEFFYGFHIGVTNAPPPPTVVYEEEPEVIIVPETKVYVVDRGENECDFFRYGNHWYLMAGGFWYVGGSYDGKFRVIDVREVPPSILSVPAKHWKHHPKGGPPGLAKKAGGSEAKASKQVAKKGNKGKGR